MGMFDYIRCDYPLPSNPSIDATINFQTKDFDCLMQQYVITVDGKLQNITDPNQPLYDTLDEDLSTFSEIIEIYTNNIVASVGSKLYTANGEDVYYLEYKVTFLNGSVVAIEEIENRKETACSVELLR
jgi:hypothetical protein